MANPTGAIPGARAEEPVTPINNGETTSLITDLTGRLRVRIAATGANGIPIDIFSGINGGMQIEDAIAGDALNNANAAVIEPLSVQHHSLYNVQSIFEATFDQNANTLKYTPGRLYRAQIAWISGVGEGFALFWSRTTDGNLHVNFPFAAVEINNTTKRVATVDFGVFGVHFNPGLMVTMSTETWQQTAGSPIEAQINALVR
jgi:hypothetical protein